MASINCFNFLHIFISILLLNVNCAENNKLSSNAKAPWNSTATDMLKHDLLMHYDKFSRPHQHYNSTNVTIGLTVRHIAIDENKDTFTVDCWVSLTWNDNKLKWNSSDYDGLNVLHVADHEIWQPDLVAYNSAAGSTIDHFANTHCLVKEDGTVIWVPLAQFVVFCSMNFRYWPFDTQYCSIKLGSWTYDGNQVDIQLGSTSLDLLVQNSEWEIVKFDTSRHIVIYQCCLEPYPDITFTFDLQRRSPTYKALIITPTFVLIILTLLSFWLPPQCGEKILLNCTTAIIICLFLLYFTKKCPAMGDHIPLIVLFYSSSLYVISFCTIGSVFVLWISKTQHHRPLPWIIKHALTGWLGRWLGLSSYINQTSLSGRSTSLHDGQGDGLATTVGEELRDQNSSGAVCDGDGDEHHMLEVQPPKRGRSSCRQQDWILFAAAVDRLSFIFYSLLFAILAISYSI